MKYLLILLCSILTTTLFAQIPEVKEQKKCYERYDAAGVLIPKDKLRYAEWQCGKLAGVIDCNEKLTYEEDVDIVYAGNNGGPYTGRCETCHMNGILERRVTFVNGKQHGVDTTTYSSGCRRVIQSHIQGVKNGTEIYYYDSTGYVAWEMNYQLGEKHGRQIYFKNKNEENLSDTTLWENYNAGNLHGVKRTYYSKSRIKNVVHYDNGILDGSFKVHNLKGIVIQNVNYRQGKKDKEIKYYYDDGTLLSTEHWSMGVKNGEFTTFFYQGDIQVQQSYKNGQKVGWFVENYPSNKTKQRILYDKKGVRAEEHRYDEQGRETYSFGAPDTNGAEDDEVPIGKQTKAQKKEAKRKAKLAKKEAKRKAKAEKAAAKLAKKTGGE
ncbi:MAG: antitoxin component YwqK of YwqJK toxin-antitoxin module [Crocinitomicaceae bacterium]|jgi:antitoxin component YwqK of YwqJK toxin-antitoxin module